MTEGYIDVDHLTGVEGAFGGIRDGTGLLNGSPRPSVKLPIRATPFVWRDPRTIPRRRWLYGFHYIRQFVSTTVAPGGVGKSSLSIIEALAMATNRPLLGVTPNEHSRVWLWNGEDPRDEIDRRVAAACIRYGIKPEEVGGRLFIDSGRDTEIIIATEMREGARVAVPEVDQMIATIRANGIDAVIIDPFVSSHRVSENNNNAIDLVVKAWARIADACNCSVELVHHARKTGGAEVTVEDGRGAVALLAGARSARVLNGMTKEEGERAGIEKPRGYFRVDNGKANLAPPPDKAAWYHLASVSLDNGEGPADLGEQVAVVEPWQWPDPLADMSVGDLDAVLNRVRSGKWRADPQSPDWVGRAVAEALNLDLTIKSERSKVTSCIGIWTASGALKTVDGKDEKSNTRKFVVVGDG